MKNLSIKSQILAAAVIALSILSIILTYSSVSISRDALIQKSYDALTSARDSKAEQIQNFFSERIGDINVMSESKNIQDLVKDLLFVHKELEVQGNAKYPVNHPLAKEKKEPHEKFFFI